MSYDDDDDFALSDDEEEMSPGTLEKEDSTASIQGSSNNLIKKKSSSEDDPELTRQTSSNAAPPGSIESVINQVSNSQNAPLLKKSLSKSSSMKRDSESPTPSSKTLKKKQSGSASNLSNTTRNSGNDQRFGKRENSNNSIMVKKGSFQRSQSSKKEVLSPIKAKQESSVSQNENEEVIADEDEYDLDGSFEDDESIALQNNDPVEKTNMKRSVSFVDSTKTASTANDSLTSPASSSRVMQKAMSKSNSRTESVHKKDDGHGRSKSIVAQGSKKDDLEADRLNQPSPVKKVASSSKLQKSSSKSMERLPSSSSNKEEKLTSAQNLSGTGKVDQPSRSKMGSSSNMLQKSSSKPLERLPSSSPKITNNQSQEHMTATQEQNSRSVTSAGEVRVSNSDPVTEAKPSNQSSTNASSSNGSIKNADNEDNDDYDNDNGFEDEECNVVDNDQATAKGKSQDIANSVIVTPQKSRPENRNSKANESSSESVATKSSRRKKPTKEEIEYSIKISELDKKIREIAAEREKYSPVKMPKKKLPKVNKKDKRAQKTKAPKKFNHSKLKFIMADVTISPYMTSPDVEYSKETLHLPEILRHMKYDNSKNNQLPMNEKEVKDKFIGAYNFRKKDIH